MVDEKTANNNSGTRTPTMFVAVPMEQGNAAYTTETSLIDIFDALWKSKKLLIFVVIVFAIISISVSLMLPNKYISKALISPTNSESGHLLGGVSGQLGGLASLAGINLGGQSSNKSVLALEIMKSRKFLESVINKHELMVDLFAVKKWDPSQNKIIYDKSVFDTETLTWTRETLTGALSVPTMQEAYAEFVEILSINTNKDTGLITVSIEHHSPHISKYWVELIVDEINQHMKYRDQIEAEKSIGFLQKQMESTVNTDHKALLYQLIEEQLKTLMFTKVRDEYIFQSIDPAVVPEKKSKPNRALIVIAGTIVGGIFAIAFVLIRYFVKSNSNTKPNSTN